MKTFLLVFLVTSATISKAQSLPAKLDFALPEHAGRLSIDRGNFEVKELSAKPNGREYGVKAQEDDLHLLAFLFVWPEHPHLTAESCRDEMLKSEGVVSKDIVTFKSKSGTNIAAVLLIPKDASSSSIRAFVASGDLCGDILISFPRPVTQDMMPMQKVRTMLETVEFDPAAKPTFRDAFMYATVEYNKHEYAGAANAYRSAPALVDHSDDPLKWRRVTTDQLSMSYGISGDLKDSRAVNEAAIAKDPEYPLYYYNLACADAEQGDAKSARIHLQQAFQRKSNTLPGESLPDPASDDSILKLKEDKSFWAFVQTLGTASKP